MKLVLLQAEPQFSVFAQVNLKDATITIKAGSTGQSITVKIGEGNLTYTERRNIQYTLDKGLIDEVREGDQAPLDVSLQFTWLYISPSSTGESGGEIETIEDAIKGTGAASGWSSSDADSCRPYAVDIRVLLSPDCSASIDQLILLADYRWEELQHDLKAGTISSSGKCNIQHPTITFP